MADLYRTDGTTARLHTTAGTPVVPTRADEEPVGSLIAGVWSATGPDGLTTIPDIPGAVEVIVVAASGSWETPTTSMSLIHSAAHLTVVHGRPAPITFGASLVAMVAIGLTQPITPTVHTTGLGLTVVADLPDDPTSTPSLPGVEWEIAATQPGTSWAAVAALALVEEPHSWVVPAAYDPRTVTITW